MLSLIFHQPITGFKWVLKFPGHKILTLLDMLLYNKESIPFMEMDKILQLWKRNEGTTQKITSLKH